MTIQRSHNDLYKLVMDLILSPVGLGGTSLRHLSSKSKKGASTWSFSILENNKM